MKHLATLDAIPSRDFWFVHNKRICLITNVLWDSLADWSAGSRRLAQGRGFEPQQLSVGYRFHRMAASVVYT